MSSVTVSVGGSVGLVPRTAFDDAAIQIIREVETAEHLTLKTMGEIAHELSSGTATEQMLSTPLSAGGLAHPYGHGAIGSLGVRGAIPNGGDSAIINVQTGQFLAGWNEQVGNFRNGEMVNVLENVTEHARLLEDTPDENQIRRPIVDRIVHLIEPIREMNLAMALEEIDKL